MLWSGTSSISGCFVRIEKVACAWNTYVVDRHFFSQWVLHTDWKSSMRMQHAHAIHVLWIGTSSVSGCFVRMEKVACACNTCVVNGTSCKSGCFLRIEKVACACNTCVVERHFLSEWVLLTDWKNSMRMQCYVVDRQCRSHWIVLYGLGSAWIPWMLH